MKKRTILGMIIPLFLFIGIQIQAQKLDDFKACASKKYTECIPFPDLRSEAIPMGKEVDARKIIPSQISKNTLEPQHKNIMDELNKLNDKLKAEQKNQADWKKAHPTGPNAYDKTVADAEKKIKEHEPKVKAIYAKIAEGKEAYERLYNARGALREMFDDVLKKLEYARNNPKAYINESSYKSSNKAESDKKLAELTKELIGYIDTIEAHINSEKSTHFDEEKKAKDCMNILANL